MKKPFVVLLLMHLLIVPQWVAAQGWGYDGNRIAVSSDGNSAPDPAYKWPTGDPDDWGANAAILGILAKRNLHHQLVHFSYNNFLDAPAGPDDQNENKISCDAGIREFGGFSACVFFDVTTQLHEARSNLANEMARSSAADPLYFVHAGLSEFLYLVVKEVMDMGKAESLRHVYLVSHSGFNENETRRPWHRTWADVQELCGHRINYKKIPDQNACGNPSQLWCSGSDFSVWYWMRDHRDPKVRFIYDRLAAHKGNKADISDCGMVYFLLTGDAAGSPAKFREFLGDGIPYREPLPCPWVTVPVSSMHIVQDSIELTEYDRTALNVKVLPDNATCKGVLWTSSDPAVAEVRIGGTITAKKAGTTMIQASTMDGAWTDEITVVASARDQGHPRDLESGEAAVVQEEEGLLIIEAETFKLNGGWKRMEDASAAGGQCIEFDGPNLYTEPNPAHTITCQFLISNPGHYTVKWYVRQPEGQRGTDKGNDVWIFFPDQVGYAGEHRLDHFVKFYGRSTDEFVLNGIAEGHDFGHKWLTARFDKPGRYRLSISGRSASIQLDRIVLYQGMTFEQAKARSAVMAEIRK